MSVLTTNELFDQEIPAEYEVDFAFKVNTVI
jgi:hypothetical protein